MDNLPFKEIKAAQLKLLNDFIAYKKAKASELEPVFLKIWDISILTDFYNSKLTGVDQSSGDLEMPSHILSINTLAHIYHLCCLFPNENILNHFKKVYGFKDDTLRWFISYEKILENINKINQKQEFYLDPYCTVVILDSYLYYKIMYVVASFYFKDKKYDKSIQSVMAIELFKIYQNRENRVKSGNFADKTPIDKFVGNLDVLFQKIIESQELNTTPKRLLKNIFNGKVEDFLLIQLYKDIAVPLRAKIPERNKQIAFFDLLKLFIKDRHWLTKDEWEKLEHRRNYPAPYDNYEIYMATTVKKFIQKK